ncbi:hypothetical protein [Entomomonas asaccharolytica]|uniref:Uncharacterized protein n=1 Tax=Entomomonas asaccharolytica TaxID=2785331 RepID=A0A974RW23_9GAMM|nr:hypothetical protein [Entomomonas asaccharolytica]QQP84738.1 hypothetical protein JHT90_10000 [Entomomonas asaccharolytica]
MNTLQKLTATIALIAMPISMAYSSPCYTNTEDGCGNSNEKVIHVQTKDTGFGFCTEYLNNNNEKVTRCHSELSEEEKLIAQQKAIAEAQAPKQTTSTTSVNNYNYNYNVVPNSNQVSNTYSTGYNYGYSYGYNYYRNNYNYYPNYYYSNKYHRPRPPNHHNHQRPPHKNQNITLPSISFGQKNNMTPTRPRNNSNISRPANRGSGSHSSPRATLPSTKR